MKSKLIGSYYPKCNSKNTNFIKGEALDGAIYVNNGNLVFQRKIFLYFNGKTRLEIPLNNIERVENCNLNNFMPYGVCIFTKDNKEYMLGHVNNKKLQDFILNAKAGVVPNTKEKSKKVNKIVNILLAILLIILFIVVIGLGIKNFMQERVVKNELETINELNASTDTIDMDIKAKGNHGKVEQAMKEYYQDYFDKKKIFNSNRAEVLFNTLTVDYLKENKSKLKSLKLDEMVEDKTNELNEAVNGIIEMLESHNIMAYVYKYDLLLYYNNFYRDIMVSKNDSEIQKDWQDLMDRNSEKAEYLKQIIEILVDNTNHWYIEDNQLYFSSDSLLEEYNKLHGLIYEDIDLDSEISDIAL